MEKIVLRLTEIGTRQDPYSVLSQVVAAVSRDQVQLRMLIYEFARNKLRQDLYPQFVAGDWSEVERSALALEAAIAQVEADFANADAPAPIPFIPEPALDNVTLEPLQQSALIIRPDLEKSPRIGDYDASVLSPLFPPSTHEIEPTYWLSTTYERDDRHPIARLNEKLQSKFGWTIQLIVAVVLGVAIFAAIDGRSAHRPGAGATIVTAANVNNGEQTASPDGKSLATAKVVARPSMPNMPIPSAYGIYAVTNGQLTELDLLPIKVPDQRVAISAPISTPSRAHLPTGQLEFVVYRRDLASDAPDRVAVRIVAQVMRALTFEFGGQT